MNHLGLKNFRRFENQQDFDFGRINFFVGCNNSGKSTVVKAILLLYSNINSLTQRAHFSQERENLNNDFSFTPMDFHKALHIGSFARAVNVKHRNDSIILETGFRKTRISFEIAKNESEHLGSAPIKNIVIKDLNTGSTISIDYLKKNVSFDLTASAQRLKKLSRENINEDEAQLHQVNAEISSLKEFLEKNNQNINDVKLAAELTNQKFSDDSRKTEQIKAFSEKVIETFSSQHELVNRRLQERLSEAARLQSKIDQAYDSKDPIQTTIAFDELPVRIPFVPSSQYASYISARDIPEKLMQDPAYQGISQIERYFNILDGRISRPPSVEYIYAHSVSQDTFYKVNDRDDYMSQTIQSFHTLNLKSNPTVDEFIKKWMRNFGIGHDYETTSIDGDEGFFVKIIDENNNKINLAEKGMGSIQLMVLLLKMGLLIKKKRRGVQNVLIEEPEQNLHPSLQAQLADLFYELSQQHTIRFFVETHSEYIIRRVQALIAQQNLSDEDFKEKNPFKVFYFPSEGDAYDMELTPTGRFAKNFDQGFFDVASRLNMEVFKAEKARQNV